MRNSINSRSAKPEGVFGGSRVLTKTADLAHVYVDANAKGSRVITVEIPFVHIRLT